ncbi:uncharacterized protein SOCE836_092980 [Sorangium cellulosum]|uniref:Uncharacterized protein n=1 Tax=Sorangium cellulosum TaxID=56 RepID=A0A4P2R281_SORCE|nr:uncharacterized protein SOCE836_092980 [Sorangium cellulosum]WCQ96372.1 hypothetical protein NQZ70_09158 [Sorangium sp. Soce836]
MFAKNLRKRGTSVALGEHPGGAQQNLANQGVANLVADAAEEMRNQPGWGLSGAIGVHESAGSVGVGRTPPKLCRDVLEPRMIRERGGDELGGRV